VDVAFVIGPTITPPIVTISNEVAVSNPVPIIVMAVPPCALIGEKLVIVGLTVNLLLE